MSSPSSRFTIQVFASRRLAGHYARADSFGGTALFFSTGPLWATACFSAFGGVTLVSLGFGVFSRIV